MTVLAGKVIDVHTGYPLAGVEVGCMGPGGARRCHSDEGGHFGFIDVHEGCWRLSVKKSPYSEHNCKYCFAGELFVNICLELEGLDDEAVTA